MLFLHSCRKMAACHFIQHTVCLQQLCTSASLCIFQLSAYLSTAVSDLTCSSMQHSARQQGPYGCICDSGCSSLCNAKTCPKRKLPCCNVAQNQDIQICTAAHPGSGPDVLVTSSETIAGQKEQAKPYSASLAVVVDADCCALTHPRGVQDLAITALHVIVHYFTTNTTPGKLVQAACTVGKSHTITR